MSPSVLFPLEACSDPDLVGGKAYGLWRLMQHGFHVPPGICVPTTVYRATLRSYGIEPDVQWSSMLRAGSAERGDLLRKYSHAILTSQPSADLLADIDQSIRERHSKGETLWAVRSSATHEDDPRSSFAGLYHTQLNVPIDRLALALVRCWASVWTERVVEYAIRQRLDSVPYLAVLIQPMIAARISGVAYSCDPLTLRADCVSINAVSGLGDSLVGGTAVPDTIRVGLEPNGEAGRIVDAIPAVRSEDSPIPGTRDSGQGTPQTTLVLTEDEVMELARLVKRVERSFGCPVDVEWTIDHGQTWLLQARPITTTSTDGMDAGQSCVWSRANFKETLPEVPSPLAIWFLEQFMETNILSHYRGLGCAIPSKWTPVRVVGGRPYINVTLFQSLITQLGGKPELVSQQMGGPEGIGVLEVKSLPLWRLIGAGVSLVMKAQHAKRQAPRWFARMKAMDRAVAVQDLFYLTVGELQANLDRLGDELRRGDLTFAIVAGVGQCFQAMDWMLPRWIGDGWHDVLNRALQGQGTVISANQIAWLGRLAEQAGREPTVAAYFASTPWNPDAAQERLRDTEFLRQFEAFLAEYGHRGVGESDVMSPRYADQPAYLLDVIRTHVLSPPAQVRRSSQGRRDSLCDDALEEMRRRCGWRMDRWVAIRWWYRRLCRFLELRESNRHALMYFCRATRRLLLALGMNLAQQMVLDTASDVFFVSPDELRSSSLDPRKLKPLVAERREARARHEGLRVPDTLGSAPGGGEQQPAGSTLRGVPVSAGSAEGPARVVSHPSDYKKVARGDIIITSVIDPGMAPLFSLAAGVVAEIGGTLSHGAIILREYGLPAVVNVSGITRCVTDGDFLVVNGSKGEVRRGERAENDLGSEA